MKYLNASTTEISFQRLSHVWVLAGRSLRCLSLSTKSNWGTAELIFMKLRILEFCQYVSQQSSFGWSHNDNRRFTWKLTCVSEPVSNVAGYMFIESTKDSSPSSSLTLQTFKSVFGFPRDRCPFCFAKALVLHLFYSTQVQFDIIHPSIHLKLGLLIFLPPPGLPSCNFFTVLAPPIVTIRPHHFNLPILQLQHLEI